MYDFFLSGIQTLNDLLTAGVAITAFSLFLYALTFNLNDRVARSFATILLCVVIVYVGEALSTVADTPQALEFWLRFEWLGITFLPASYFHFSDALLATTGRPSRGRRRKVVWISYTLSFLFLISMGFSLLVGPLVPDGVPAPHLQPTWLTYVFALYYIVLMLLSWWNFFRARDRTVTSASHRRMNYLITGALAPAIGAFPYLLFGPGLAQSIPMFFWILVSSVNLFVSVFLVLMAYSVAFFGVPWPDRVVKRRLVKWLMRGPVTASIVLAITTLIHRIGKRFDVDVSSIVSVAMVASILILEHLITLAAPVWERMFLLGKDRSEVELLQTLEKRLLTYSDLYQFLEAILAAICDRLQVSTAFIASLDNAGFKILVTIGEENLFENNSFPVELIKEIEINGHGRNMFSLNDYWIIPLHDQRQGKPVLIGLIGTKHRENQTLDDEQFEALEVLTNRATLALRDRAMQQQAFSSLEALSPQIDFIQRLRAASRYDGTEILTSPDVSELPMEPKTLSKFVKDALTHYWGGPKLTKSPLINLHVVQQTSQENEGNRTNALRAVLRKAIEQTRPEGERQYTGEWMLYNILNMKFMEGRKVREIARRLAMSEADLYRKQRVAIEAVAVAIVQMEQEAIEKEEKQRQEEPSTTEHTEAEPT